MAPSPAKRRKLSPTTSVAVPASVPNTPSRIPIPSGGAKTMPGRPSFASPTKASIAKHNPQLLERPQSARADAVRAMGKENVSQPVERQLFGRAQSREVGGELEETSRITDEVGLEGISDVQGSTTTFTGVTAEAPMRSTNGALSAPPRRRSQSRTPGKENIRPETSSTAIEPILVRPDTNSTLPPDPFRTTGLRRSPLNSRPVPESEAAVVDQADISDPFRTVGLRRSPGVSEPLATQETQIATEKDQLELPLTPTERGLVDPVVTTPPSGIHNTPSKHPKKRPRGTKPKSSPLKPRAEPEPEVEAEVPIKRRKLQPEPRRIVPPDPDAEKKKIRDQLLEEVKQLQADVALAERENERQRIQHKSKKPKSAEAPNPDEILDLLKRTTAPTTPITQPKKTTISQHITSFLPFAKRRRPPPPPPANDIPPATNLPITLDEPISHLKLFTPLAFESAIFLLPPTPPTITTPSSTDILQSHTIAVRAPSGLLTARLGMIVNTTTFSITSLNIEKLDPFADLELGIWMRERASGKNILGRDVNAICWAMGRWYDVAVKRARFWLILEKELGSEEGRRRSNERIEKAAKRKKTIAEGEEEDANDGDAASGKQKWTRRLLLPHMGQQDFVIASAKVELRIEWNILFDWTGEAESVVSASARVPLSWQEADTRNSLAKFPQTFEALVQTRGPLAAARASVALLMRE